MTQKTEGQKTDNWGPMLEPGTVLTGNFVVREVVGQGGMAVVYRGTQKSLNRTVALKVLHARFSSDPRFIERFEAEAGALASLSHPNIVNIIDRGFDGEHYFFVMEMVEGKTLDQLIIANLLSRSDWKRVVGACRDALEYVHKRGVVHRDIKPSNILIHEEGAVKIGDFGIAHIVHGDEKMKSDTSGRSPRAVGTANYMAPEQISNPGGVDPRADIFSLAVTFYKMFARALPVGNFPDPSAVNPEVPEGVDGVLAKAMAEDRDERYGTITDFCDDLLKALKDQGTSITSVLGKRKAGSGASSLYSGEDFKAKSAGPSDSRFKLPEITPRPQKQPKPPKGQVPPSAYSTSDLLRNLTPTPKSDSTSSGYGTTPSPVVTPVPAKKKAATPKPAGGAKKGSAAMPVPAGKDGEKKTGMMITVALLVLLLVAGVVAAFMMLGDGGGGANGSSSSLTPVDTGLPQTRISEERERLLEEVSRERAEELAREVDMLRGRIAEEIEPTPAVEMELAPAPPEPTPMMGGLPEINPSTDNGAEAPPSTLP